MTSLSPTLKWLKITETHPRFFELFPLDWENWGIRGGERAGLGEEGWGIFGVV